RPHRAGGPHRRRQNLHPAAGRLHPHPHRRARPRGDLTVMEITNVEKLTDEKWLNLFAATYRHTAHQGRWVFASRSDKPDPKKRHCDAVLMVAVLRDPDQPPRLVMIKEFRVPVGDYVYGLPAGLLEPGEAIETTVRREMLEETGLAVTAVK